MVFLKEVLGWLFVHLLLGPGYAELLRVYIYNVQYI